MREDLEDALDLYEGMNEAGRKHWRARGAFYLLPERRRTEALFG